MEINKEHIRILLLEKIGGTISDEDDQWVESVMASDESVRLMWEEMQSALSTPQGRRFLDNLDEDHSWNTLQNNLQPIPPRRARLVSFKKWGTIAAACLVCLALVYVYYSRRDTPVITETATTQPAPEKKLQLKLDDGKGIDLPGTGKETIDAGNVQLVTTGNKLTYTLKNEALEGWGTLIVPRKLDYKILLKDGTEVWLNAETSLRFPYTFTANTRDVYLEGEAWFKVAKDPAKPFIVHTPQTTIQVLGTSFNVNTYVPGSVFTSLVEGSVVTSNGHQTLKLTPGYRAAFKDGKFVTEPFDPNETLSWMEGVSYFHDAKLSDISLIVSRWFDVKVVFDNPDLLNTTFTGAIYKNKPLDVFIANIALSSGINASIEKGELHLK